MKQRVVWFVAAMVVAVVLAVMATTPPAPDTATSNPVEPSTQRAFAHVERIAAQPHPTGSTANAVVRDYLVGELEAMGLSVETVSGTLDEAGQAKLDYWRDKSSETPTEFANVIGVLPGADPTLPAVALMAHYDSVWGSPGASDDAAGVASILETVRAIAAAGPVERDIVVVLTDAEELGLVGARQFFGENPLAERIGAIVNLEARGGGGVASMFQTSPGNAEVARVYARTVDHPSTSSLATYIYSVLPNDTDLSAALDRGGYAAFNIAFIGRSGLYHSPLSTPENLDRGSLNQMLGQTHALALALANAATLPQETGDAVFFDAFGLATIVYSPWVGWVMLVLGIGGYALAWWRRDRTERGFVSGVGRMAALILVGGVLLYGLNLVSGAGTGAGYYDRLAAIPKLTTMALLVVLGLAVALWGRGTTGFAQRSGAADRVAGDRRSGNGPDGGLCHRRAGDADRHRRSRTKPGGRSVGQAGSRHRRCIGDRIHAITRLPGDAGGRPDHALCRHAAGSDRHTLLAPNLAPDPATANRRDRPVAGGDGSGAVGPLRSRSPERRGLFPAEAGMIDRATSAPERPFTDANDRKIPRG